MNEKYKERIWQRKKATKTGHKKRIMKKMTKEKKLKKKSGR